MTLYKLMNLYMLKQVNFPLTNAQLSGFFLDREYTTYFTLQQALNELLEAGLIKMQTLHNAPDTRLPGKAKRRSNSSARRFLPPSLRIWMNI